MEIHVSALYIHYSFLHAADLYQATVRLHDPPVTMENFQIFFPDCSSAAHPLSSTGADSVRYDGGLAMRGAMEFTDRAEAEAEAEAEEEEDEERSAGEMETVKVGKSSKGEKKTRKHRYAFQTRSQVDVLDDGYRWRKYGQKAVKNNKFPRSYYKCSHEGCSVKKQIQRLTNDDGVVLTTYEGVHSHAIQTPPDNFQHILTHFQIYPSSFF